MYTSYLRLIKRNGYETWGTIKGDDYSKIKTIQRKMFGKIFEALYNIESNKYAIRHNTIVQIVQNIYRRSNTLLSNRSWQREWFGDVPRANSKMMKRVKKGKITGKRHLERSLI